MYEWIVIGALGNVIASGTEPAWCIADKQAAKHSGDREDVTTIVRPVKKESENVAN